MYNGSSVTVNWRTATEAEMAAKVDTVQLRVQPLPSDELPAMFFHASADDELWRVKLDIGERLYKWYHRAELQWEDKPATARCHLFNPVTSGSELADDESTLSALGLAVQLRQVCVGVQWDGGEIDLAEYLRRSQPSVKAQPR